MPYLRTRLGRWFFEDVEREGGTFAGAPTIVLLHSLLCDGGMWRGQVGPLRALGRVVVIDSPGHGKSDVPPPFTLEDHTRALLDAFEELRIGRAIVAGVSWGGMLAMRVALHHPGRLAAMAILDSSADGTLWKERLEYRAMCAVVRAVGMPPRLLKERVVPLMFAPRTRTHAPELVDEFVRTLGGFSREGVTRATKAVSIDRPSIVEELRRITVPTLVGYGEYDKATPAAHSRRIASRIGGSLLAVFEGGGHLAALEVPDAVNQHLVPFVREHMG